MKYLISLNWSRNTFWFWNDLWSERNEFECRILKERVPYAEFETASHVTSEAKCKTKKRFWGSDDPKSFSFKSSLRTLEFLSKHFRLR